MMMPVRKILFVLSGKERKKMFLLLGVDTLISIADIGFLVLLLYVVNFYAQKGDSPLHSLPAWLASRDSGFLIGIFLLLFITKSWCAYLALQARYRFVFQVASRLASDNLQLYQEGDLSGHVDTDSAVHHRRIAQQPIEFSQYILAGSMQAFTESVLIVLAVTGIILYNARLFLLLLILLMPALIILSYITKRRLREVRSGVRASSEGTLQYLREALAGFIESNVYGRNLYFAGRYGAQQKRLNEYLAELQIIQGVPSRLIEVFAILGLFILVSVHASSFVVLGAFIAAAYKIIPGIVKLSNIAGQMKTYQFVLPELAKVEWVAPKISSIRGFGISRIAMEGVSFCYPGKQILLDLSFELGKGDFIGLSGPSGSGKTSVLHLLLGFLVPDKGAISINGEVLSPADLRKFRTRIAYVAQQPFIMHDTLLRNITLGSDLFDDERMQTALLGAGWPGPYPDCLGLMIQEQGRNISGGQRQRIAIARALYKETDVILLDEPFNELDHASEASLLQLFLDLSQSGKIVILITHRVESFSFCNKVVSLYGKGK